MMLKLIMDELLKAADLAAAGRYDANFGYKVKIKNKSAFVRLGHGLGIRLRKDGWAYILTIWRVGKMPSMREWNTVTANFPYDTPISTPEGKIDGKIHYYKGRIPGRPV